MIAKIFVVGQTGFRHEHLAVCRGSSQGTRKECGEAIRPGALELADGSDPSFANGYCVTLGKSPHLSMPRSPCL